MYRLKSPLSAQLEITNACNNTCKHCYNYWRYLQTGLRLSSDLHEKSFDHFRILLDILIVNEVRTVSFTGGEPFLRRDVLFDLIEIAKNGGMKTVVNTNGSLITNDDIFHLKDVGVDFLLVSLLCDKPSIHNRMANSDTHSFTSAAIARLAKSGLSLSINMVVTSYNWNRVRQTAIYTKDLGVKTFSATPVLPCPLAKEHSDLLLKPEQVKKVLDDLLWVKQQGMNVDVLEPIVHCMFTQAERTRFSQFLNNRSCAAGISDVAISSNGDVRPCILATKTYGNLITDGWQTVWKNLASWSAPNLLPEDCLNCTIVDDCGGGCRVAALSESGSINGKDPYMTKPLSPSAYEPIKGALIKAKPSLDSILSFSHDVSVREEAFGSVVFNERNFVFLDVDGTRLIKHLISCPSFTIKSILDEFDIDEKGLTSFLVTLIGRRILNFSSAEGGE